MSLQSSPCKCESTTAENVIATFPPMLPPLGNSLTRAPKASICLNSCTSDVKGYNSARLADNSGKNKWGVAAVKGTAACPFKPANPPIYAPKSSENFSTSLDLVTLCFTRWDWTHWIDRINKTRERTLTSPRLVQFEKRPSLSENASILLALIYAFIDFLLFPNNYNIKNLQLESWNNIINERQQ